MSRRTHRGIWGRRRDERGAVAVTVALLMVPLIGFAAISVDVAALWAQRQQLQTGADAAALAIASDCVRGDCGTPSQTAATVAAANLRGGTPTATVTARTSTSVTVSNTAVQSFVFAPVLGISSRPVTAEATATWSAASGGTGALPVVVNSCELGYQPSTTVPRTILLSRTTTASSCTPSGFPFTYSPGGFAWVRTNDPGNPVCATSSTTGGELQLSAFQGPPVLCPPSYFQSLQNDTVLLPVFREGRYNFLGGVYFKISGYASFKLTGYYFGGSYTWNPPCSGSERCFRGYFTGLGDTSAASIQLTD